MTCVEFQRRLSAYLDSELSRWTRWKVETHVRDCPECAGLLRDLEDTDGCLLLGVELCQERLAARDYLTGAVMRRLPAMPPASRARPAARVWAAGLALATQLAAVGGAYWWGFAHGSQHPDRTGAMVAPGVTPRGAGMPRAVAPSSFQPEVHSTVFGSTVRGGAATIPAELLNDDNTRRREAPARSRLSLRSPRPGAAFSAPSLQPVGSR